MPRRVTTTWTSIGAGRSQAITAIPKGDGRKIEFRLVVPLGASESTPKWRVVEELIASTALSASDVEFTPAGGIAATDVQAALQELDSEKAPKVSPTLTTPALGVAAATSINKVAITAPATAATLTIPDGTTVTTPPVTSTLTGKPAADVGLTAQAASIGTTNLLAAAPAGTYRISWGIRISQAATTSASIIATI